MKNRIHAIHDRDLLEFLTKFNLVKKIEDGEIMCPECNCLITLENIGFIKIIKNKPRICCDNILCFYDYKKGKFSRDEIISKESVDS